MLRINPLQPPRPFAVACAPAAQRATVGAGFVAAEDYDSTGIMAGVDPSESRYWWLPELYGPEPGRVPAAAATSAVSQATRRTGEPTAAAA
jgi:hypothetical protein